MSQLQPNAGSQPADTAPPAFPCREFPAQQRHARLLGIYPQRQPGRFMHRVRIPGGILSASQWRVLAQIPRRFSPATPLHLTTRQDIELHDLSADDVPGVQRALAEVGLTSLGSGGDTLRNIVLCPPSAGGTSDSLDLLPLAQAIGQALATCEGLFALPRKFKISLGCAPLCGRPFIHDLALGAACRDGQWGFEVIGAGSLGVKPALGIVLMEWIAPADALPLAVATLRLFARHGDRQNRAKARLRHVRERLGDQAFLAALTQEFDAAKAERPWPPIALAANDAFDPSPRVLTFPNGDITADAADALANLAERQGVSVRIDNDHTVSVFTAKRTSADDALAHAPALSQAIARQANVIACPGTRWCSRALADTNGLADRIRAALAGVSDAGLTVAVSGCPNGCAGSAVADVGLLGGKSSADGQVVEKYTLVSGGGKGASDALAQPVAAGLTADQAAAEVTRLAQDMARGPR